jgi:hypothetical protein
MVRYRRNSVPAPAQQHRSKVARDLKRKRKSVSTTKAPRLMHGLAETNRVGYGDPFFGRHVSKKTSNRKRNRAAITVSRPARVRGIDEDLLAARQLETLDRPHWGLPSVPTEAAGHGSHMFSATLFLDGREDLKLSNCVSLREDYLNRLKDLTVRHTSAARHVRVGSGFTQSQEERFLDVQEIVDVLDLIRFVTVEVVEGIGHWRKRRRHTCSHGTEANNRHHACGDNAPYIWQGINYLLKIPNDLDMLCGIHQLVDYVGFEFKRNPFLLTEALSPFSYASASHASAAELDHPRSRSRLYSPPTIDMRRIRACADLILDEENMHGIAINRPLSRMQAYSRARRAQQETEWDQRLTRLVMPKLAGVVVAHNVRLCFKRQEGFVDGLLTYGEFGRAVHRMGQLQLNSQEELDWLTRKLDRVQCGFVAFNDFCALVRQAKKSVHQRSQSERQFRLADTAGVGNVGKQANRSVETGEDIVDFDCHTVANTLGEGK